MVARVLGDDVFSVSLLMFKARSVEIAFKKVVRNRLIFTEQNLSFFGAVLPRFQTYPWVLLDNLIPCP